MTENVGYATLGIIPSLRGFESKLNASTGHVLDKAGTTGGSRFGTGFGTKASHSIHAKFAETAKYIIGPLIGAFAIEKIGGLIKESIQAASDLAGAQNRVKLVFGGSSEEVVKFSENAAKSYGVADAAARNASAGFGILFQTAGLSRKENEKSSVAFVKLSADLAAFGHTDFNTAFTALQKGLGGATRGLKPYGILIDGAQQKAEALRLGLLKPVKDQAKIHAAQVAVLTDQVAYNAEVAKSGPNSLAAQTAQAKLGSAQETLRKSVEGTIPPLTAQQKVLANQSLILQQSKTQQGQFGRSSKDLAQQQKILGASFDNAKDRLGKGLLPIVTDLVGFLNKHAIPAIDDFSTWFQHDGARAIKHFENEVKPLAHSALPALATGFKDAYDFAKKLMPVAKGIFDSFNKLPGPVQKAILIGAAAGYVAKKSGLVGAGVKAIAGTVASKAAPVPVFVTNPGFGGPGGGGPSPVPLTAAEKAAATEAEVAGKVSTAAREAALAVQAAGGSVAAQSQAAARAGKAAAAALEPELKAALRFGKIVGFKGLLKTVLSPAAAFTLGDKGNEVRSNGAASFLTAADFKRAFAGSKTIPSQDILAQFGRNGFSDAKASSLLGLTHLKSSSTAIDGVRANLERASGSVELFGQSAHRNFGDVQKLARELKHLTRHKVETNYKLTGITAARRDFDDFQAHVSRHKTITQNISMVLGIGSALDGVRR